MTREEAIQYLQPIADSAHMKRYSEALGVAIAALREQEKLKPPCELCRYNPPSSSDGKPCTMCPATPKEEV